MNSRLDNALKTWDFYELAKITMEENQNESMASK